ncbi:MAG TPA: HAMP domain-containing sensor histidine kinase [Gemmatimonadales bacterium]
MLQEILRQASVALGGRPVTLWEALATNRLEPRASSHPDETPPTPGMDLYSTIDRWRIPVAAGTRWLGSRAWADGPWVVAPVRSRVPAPPPGGQERRSRERMTLELTGLCLGLGAAEPHGLAADAAHVPAMLAHEASNPLAAAQAALQLVMETVATWNDVASERTRPLVEDLGLVLDDVDRAATFLRAIQDRARTTHDRRERFDAVRVLRSCLALEHPLLRQRSLTVVVDAPLEALYLRGDPNDLFDLLVNLLRNAADAAAGRSEPIEVRLARTEDRAQLVVRDRGVGIRAEDLHRIFDPGFTTKEFGKGSGMGLAVVRRVATKFGGEVSVESHPGRGTQFTVTLPVPPQRRSEPAD